MTVKMLPAAANASHYEKPPCGSDEMEAQLQGGGELCAPECNGATCPTDVPAGVTATPKCVLQDSSSGKKYCGLFCTSDAQCDTAGGAKCSKVMLFAGVCTYPKSDASLTMTVKMLPAAASASHYEKPPCASDEMDAQLQGGGELCAPECNGATCPTDVPAGVTATPKCVLQDSSSGKKYCGLFCTSDAQCDTAGGAKCSKVMLFAGVCTYPKTSASVQQSAQLEML